MNKIIWIFCLLWVSTKVNAQTYKIVIDYDDNGNRIKRELVCEGCPSPLVPPGKEVPTPDVEQQLLTDFNMLFEVFPNPSNARITVRIDPGTLAQQPFIQIMDATGRVFMSSRATDVLSAYDLQHLSDGTYYVSLTVKDTVHRRKIVKVK